MLPRSARMSTVQFDDVMRNGVRSASKFFTLISKKTALQSRFSAVAPVKIFKKAVERSSMRRRVYGVLGGVVGMLGNITGRDIVIIAKPTAREASKDVLSADLVEALQKVFSAS